MTLFAGLLATQLTSLWSPTPDAAGYISIARSIAHGGPPTNMGSAKLHYAPGYPLLVSPAFWTSDRPFLLLLVMQWLFAVAFMLGVYYWAKTWFAGSELWITALAMANIGLWMHARTTISELPFMALLMGTALALDRFALADDPRAAAKRGLIAAALAALLSLIRPVGVLVISGYGLMVLLRACRRQIPWRTAVVRSVLVSLPAAAMVGGLLLYESRTASEQGETTNPTYLHEFKAADVSLPAQLFEGFRVRLSEVGRLLIPGMNKSYARPYQWLNINMLLYAPLFCGICWAWCRLAQQGPCTLMLMVPCYLLLHIAYPSDQGTRYLLPLLPVLALTLWWLVGRLPRYRSELLSGLVFAHLLVAVGYSVHSTSRLERINDQWPAVDQLTATMAQDTSPVLCWHLPFGLRELAMVSGDRYVDFAPNEPRDIPSQVHWLLAGSGAPACPGFVEWSRAGELVLLRRTAEVSQETPANLQR